MMQTILQEDKNFHLSEDDFEKMLLGLYNGDERLFERTFLGQFSNCLNLLKTKYSAPHEDAYDICMWALLEFRRLLLQGKITYGNLAGYLNRMVVNRYLYTLKQPTSVSLEDWMTERISEDEPETDEDYLKMLRLAWGELCDECRALLQHFYYDKLQLKEISKILNDSSEANTRKRKERCIKKLRNIFLKNLK